MKEKLGLVAYFKDEAHIMREWLLHYSRLGVARFFLYDNGSGDAYEKEIRKAEVNATVINAPHLDQHKATVRGFRRARRECEWVIVCDLDEFFYPPDGGTISGFLDGVPSRFKAVHVSWKNYLPAYCLQPTSCIECSMHWHERRSVKSGKSILRASLPTRKLRASPKKITLA